MIMMQPDRELEVEAQRLLNHLIESSDATYGFGSFTISTYDTAWISIITKDVDGSCRWLFPEAFDYVLRTQEPGGGWDTEKSPLDGILNTLAALLALKRHKAEPSLSGSEALNDLDLKISKALEYLRSALQRWDVGATKHVGFEILVPALLELLSDMGVYFAFDGKARLMAIRDKKILKFDPIMCYSSTKSTALHSLEGLIGIIDFDRVQHHKVFGSMMASPASTAAYLMHRSEWDLEAETYLRHVISAGAGQSCGGVPSAFPSTFFETTWVISTLLESGFMPEALGRIQLNQLCDNVEQAFDAEGGLVGFGADADDTAKALLSLLLIGRSPSPDSMIGKYEVKTHFKTYTTERDASFSTNCNVLNALLHVRPDPSRYVPQILKLVNFICEHWWNTNGDIEDKWSLSPYYPTMLMVQSLIRTLQLWDQGGLDIDLEQMAYHKIFVALFQAAARTLQCQKEDGSWGEAQSLEETAYGCLILARVASFPPLSPLRSQLENAISRGRHFLSSSTLDIASPEYLWIEKVTYGLPTLTQTYVLAARKVDISTYRYGERAKRLCAIPMAKVTQSAKFFSKLPLFSGFAKWQIECSLIEGYLFLSELKRAQLDVFFGQAWDEFKYFEYIPFTWTGPNYLNKTPLGAKAQLDMMVFSLLIYQSDEYMENVVARKFVGHFDKVRDVIDKIFTENEANGHSRNDEDSQDMQPPNKRRKVSVERLTNGEHKSSAEQKCQEPTWYDIMEVHETLKGFFRTVMNHPGIQAARSGELYQLKVEMRTFLLAHVAQLEDNNLYAQQGSNDSRTVFRASKSTFFHWVHHTSSEHTSCPFAFSFLTCMIGQGTEVFQSAEEKYYSQGICRHLSVMCRMYNDYGSLRRDRDEGNLNSLDFPEFGSPKSHPSEQDLKDSLFRLATYERKCLELSQAELEKVTRPGTMRAVRAFCDVTDVYGQMYILRDLTSKK